MLVDLRDSEKSKNVPDRDSRAVLAQFPVQIPLADSRIRLTLPMQIRGREEDIFVEERSPGQTVGWSALIPPHRFTLTATAALLEAEVIALPRETLREYFAANPAAGYKITLNLAVVIGHRLQLFQTMWLREMQRTVEVRSA